MMKITNSHTYEIWCCENVMNYDGESDLFGDGIRFKCCVCGRTVDVTSGHCDSGSIEEGHA